jgi:hypothetical protein
LQAVRRFVLYKPSSGFRQTGFARVIAFFLWGRCPKPRRI